MTKLEHAINNLQMRHHALTLALKHQAKDGDYGRAAETRARADEVFNIIGELYRLRRSPSAGETTDNHTATTEGLTQGEDK